MKQNLTLILMNEAVREGWREWMEKVRRVLPQTDAERPVTWIAAERLARENGRMVRLVELLREHRPVLSYRVKEEAGLLILVAITATEARQTSCWKRRRRISGKGTAEDSCSSAGCRQASTPTTNTRT